jgi:hypothetical protein
MRRRVYTVIIGDYPKEITDLSVPLMKFWAKKIGAEFMIINERKFPEWPIPVEKLQIHDLGKDYDWNYHIDADALICPDLYDPTTHVNKDTVIFTGKDMSNNRFRDDKYFWRDGRHLGACNWFTIASDWCLDLWRMPNDLTPEQAADNISPIVAERMAGVFNGFHLIDDYLLSRNIARFGLKHTTITDLQIKMNRVYNDGYMYHHQYLETLDEKLVNMENVCRFWNGNLPGPFWWEKEI